MAPGENSTDDDATRYHALFSAVGDAIAVIDEDGTIQAFNPSAERIFGHAATEIIGRQLDLLIARDDHRDTDRPMGRQWILGLGREVVGRRRDGSTFPAALTVVEWPPKHRRFCAVIMRDSSESARANAALQQSEERFRLLIDGVCDHAICMLDPEGRIVGWNSGVERLTGWTEAESIGAPLAALFGTPESSASQAHGLIEAAGRSGRAEGDGRLRRRDGAEISLTITVTTLVPLAGQARGFAVVMRDITARDEADRRQKLLMREVEHRAKNALAVVQSLVRLSWAPDTPSFIHVVEGRIAALARVHTRLAVHHWEAAPLRVLVDETLDMLEPEFRALLQVDGPDLWLSPTAAQSTALAIHELVTNACRHGALRSTHGGVAIAWRQNSAGERLSVTWTERNAIGDQSQPTEGFGHAIIRATIETQLDGLVQMDWLSDGLVCRLGIPARHLVTV